MNPAGLFQGGDDPLALVQAFVGEVDGRGAAGFAGGDFFLEAGDVQDLAVYGAVLAHDGGPFQAVLQFPDVARPVVAHQEANGAFLEFQGPSPLMFGDAAEQETGEFGDVFAAVPEGRQADGHDVEPVIEVFPETAFVHFVFEVAVGGGDDADVDFEGLGAAHPLELAFLDDPQQFGLEGR